MLRFTGALLIAVAGMLALVAFAPAQTGTPPPKGGGTDPQPVSISFRNDTKMTLVVRGSIVVKGMIRGRQPIQIKEGKTGFDNNVPPGKLSITILDNNQRPLLVNYGIVVPMGRDLAIVIRTAPNNPNQIILAPDQQ